MKTDDLFQFQMLSSMNNGGGGRNIILQTVIQTVMLFLISILDEMKSIWGLLIEKYKKKWITIPMEDIATKTINDTFENSILLDHKNSKNTVYITRVYKFDDKQYEKYKKMNAIVDALLNKLSNLNNTPILELIATADFLITYRDKPIQIDQDLYIKIISYEKDTLCDINNIYLCISSDKLTTKDIKEYIMKVYEDYQIMLQNGLSNNVYYFEQENNKKISMNDPRGYIDVGGNQSKAQEEAERYKREILNAPKELCFSMKLFSSNKRFNNIFGEHITNIKNTIDFFENNKEWYSEKGVVHHLGMLFYGLPGCGKTATIKSIANFTKRHILNINFKNIKTITQFKNLFNNERVNIYSNNNLNNDTRSISIPINKRLYVLEEIDAISDIVKQRTASDLKKESIEDELTLGEILTLLDGTMENPGRMFIITSNHPETIDKALLRPGRIDLIIHFDKATRSEFLQMYSNFFDKQFSSDLQDKIPDKILTFAEIQQLLLKNLNYKDKQDIEQLIINDINDINDKFINTKERVLDIKEYASSIKECVSDIKECAGSIKEHILDEKECDSNIKECDSDIKECDIKECDKSLFSKETKQTDDNSSEIKEIKVLTGIVKTPSSILNPVESVIKPYNQSTLLDETDEINGFDYNSNKYTELNDNDID